MSKTIAFLTFLFIVFFGFTQGKNSDGKKNVWKQEKEYLKYQKKKDYKGPDDWYGSGPSSLKDEDENYSGTSNGGSQGIQYNPQQIQQDREKQFGKKKSGGGLESDPEIERPEPITLPDIDAPDIDAPDLPDIDPPSIPISFWKVLLFIIILGSVIFLLYWYLKNKQPVNKTVLQDVENNWNPEIVSKSELELRLEEALSKENYREGVRVYFTFIMKELIRKNWIQWKLDKTNHHYLIEMTGKPHLDVFRECVRIYDLVWYGEYEIDKKIFELLQPTLLNYYHSIKSSNE